MSTLENEFSIDVNTILFFFHYFGFTHNACMSYAVRDLQCFCNLKPPPSMCSVSSVYSIVLYCHMQV